MAAIVRLLRSWVDRPVRFFTVALVVVLVAAAVERGGAALRTRFSEPGLGACWIWAPGVDRSGEPIAFYAVRDFELAEDQRGWISIVADESYVLFVNGLRVGSSSYRPNAPADLYEVSDYLDAGWNRIAVELRSSRGAGGLLASLRLGEPHRAVLLSDRTWRIFRRYKAGILKGWPLAGGERAQGWQRPPAGRWRLRRASEARPQPSVPWEFPPVRHLPALRVRFPEGDARWIELGPPRRRFPNMGSRLLFDWGEEVTGFLSLDLKSPDGEAALVYFGSEPPNTQQLPADELVMPVPGRRTWEDVHPRRFRYALIVGVEPRSAPQVRPIDPAIADRLGAPDQPRSGVFGVPPPRQGRPRRVAPTAGWYLP
ncbi:MAG: hypothetical protein GY856_17705 [bacterium]|nr:hypothetical protein [bacterium]